MADGSYKNIDDVVIGDTLMSVTIPTFPAGEDWNRWYPSSVWSLEQPGTEGFALTTTEVIYNQPIQSSGYRLFNGRVGLTGDHFLPVCRDGVWQIVRAWGVLEGDKFLTEALTEEVVETIESIPETVTVLYLDVETDDLFFGAGICTHNAKLNSSF